MQNEAGNNVDLYIPRKCSWSNQLLAAKDHGSVQLNVGILDERGVYTKENHTVAISGFIRQKGESDEAITTLVETMDDESRVRSAAAAAAAAEGEG